MQTVDTHIITELFPSRSVLYNLTLYLKCIHEYDVVNMYVSVQTFHDRYSKLIFFLKFRKYYSVEYGLTYLYF